MISAHRWTGPMGIRLLAVVLRPVVGVLLRQYLRRQARPSYDDRAIEPGPRPLRILVIGAGMAVGYGAGDDEQSLPVRLAAAVAAATGRGVVIETRAQASVRLEHTLALVGMGGAATFDAVVWSPTLEEVARGGAGRWTRYLGEICRGLQESGGASMRILLMGLPLAEGSHVLHRVGRLMADRVNERILAAAGGFDRTEYVPVPMKAIPRTDTPLFDPAYQRQITEWLAVRLARGWSTTAPSRPAP